MIGVDIVDYIGSLDYNKLVGSKSALTVENYYVFCRKILRINRIRNIKL